MGENCYEQTALTIINKFISRLDAIITNGFNNSSSNSFKINGFRQDRKNSEQHNRKTRLFRQLF